MPFCAKCANMRWAAVCGTRWKPPIAPATSWTSRQSSCRLGRSSACSANSRSDFAQPGQNVNPMVMKYLRHSLVIPLLLAMSACGEFDVQGTFVSRVTSVEKGELTNLRGGQVTCMHCPKYFSFDAKPQLVAKIIAKHGLRQIASSTQETRQLEELVKSEASWWGLADSEGKDKVYWISYQPKDVRQESAFRLLVIKGKHAYFITSGNFNPELFEAGTSEPVLPLVDSAAIKRP